MGAVLSGIVSLLGHSTKFVFCILLTSMNQKWSPTILSLQNQVPNVMKI
jgi:hypothetical protein